MTTYIRWTCTYGAPAPPRYCATCGATTAPLTYIRRLPSGRVISRGTWRKGFRACPGSFHGVRTISVTT